MISLKQLAQEIENGITAQLNDPNIKFKIWANAGEYTRSIRSANSVEAYVHGTLLSESAQNEANILAMGYNGVTLDLTIPLQAPKTLANQTQTELQKITDTDYPFLALVLSAVDNFFAIASVMRIKDASGVEYTVSLQAGRAVTGNVDISSMFGNCIHVSVLIGVYFLEGGISARNIILNVDGVRVPLSSVTINRANQKQTDVYSGSVTIKNTTSASALSIDFAFPANADNTTKQAFKSLLQGGENISHFVELNLGSVYDGKYLMTFDALNLAARGVEFAGVTGSLIQSADLPLLLDFPAYMQIAVFEFENSEDHTLFFTPDVQTVGYICGKVRDIKGTQTISVRASDYIYDVKTQRYRVYLITLGAVTVTGQSTYYSVIREAVENAE